MRRSILHALIFFAMSGVRVADAQRASEAVPRLRPNILLIIADDIGNDKVGVYQEGDNASRPATPNIDALAEAGVRFTNAYANPICSPTRATILTGQYAFRTGIGQVLVREDNYALPIYPKVIPIPIMLRLGESGYDHSEVGKWHLGTNNVGGPANPFKHGFNYTAGTRGNVFNYYQWNKQVNGIVNRVSGYLTSDTTDDAIERANAMEEPWFLWVAYNAAHKPFHTPPHHLHRQRDPRGDDVLMFAAAVEALDTELGRLFTSIDPVVFENTDVIFIGDNGTPVDAIRPAYRLRHKGTLFEGGINVPLIVAGPTVPVSSRGLVSEALVNSTDLYATVAELSGVDLKQTLPPHHRSDSISIVPCLNDPQNAVIRDYAYAEKFKPNGPPPHHEQDQQTIRDGRWKLLRQHIVNFVRVDRDRFFDLQAATPGTDGDDLCPCPERLSGEALHAYRRLAEQLDSIRER